MARCIAMAAFWIAAGGAVAGSALAQEPVPVVTVNGIKHPELRSYRSVMAGLDAFDEFHALAPGAPELRFRLLPKTHRPGATEGLALRIVGGGDPVSVPVSADGLFSVPRIRAAYDGDADLVLNRKNGLFSGVAEVRSAGLPDQQRRLGDLRLECKVTVAIVKSEMSFLARAAVNTLMTSSDWCGRKMLTYEYPSAALLEGATLVSGERKLDLSTAGYSYVVPIGDASWPDDTVVQFAYAAP